MPLFNEEQYVDEAIRSVLTQTFQNLELLVVDDGSTDHSLAIASKYASSDPRVIVVPSKENRGSAAARNEGIRLTRGKYVAFLDADDVYHPRKLELQFKLMMAKSERAVI